MSRIKDPILSNFLTLLGKKVRFCIFFLEDGGLECYFYGKEIASCSDTT